MKIKNSLLEKKVAELLDKGWSGKRIKAEILNSSYSSDLINEFIEYNKDSKYPLGIKLLGEFSNSKLFDVSVDILRELAMLMEGE